MRQCCTAAGLKNTPKIVAIKPLKTLARGLLDSKNTWRMFRQRESATHKLPIVSIGLAWLGAGGRGRGAGLWGVCAGAVSARSGFNTQRKVGTILTPSVIQGTAMAFFFILPVTHHAVRH